MYSVSLMYIHVPYLLKKISVYQTNLSKQIQIWNGYDVLSPIVKIIIFMKFGEKVCFSFFYNYCEVESCFFFSLSHNLHDLYLTNDIQRCGGLQYEHYIGDLKTYVHVINELKFGNMGSNLNTPLT